MKRGEILLLIGIFLIFLAIPLTSASIFSDFWGKITGKATSDTTALNITVGNSAPTVPFVFINATYNPAELTTRSITFNFTAQDNDGVSNLNDSTAAAYFQRGGQTTRSNTTCVPAGTSGNQKNYTCTILMWYFDQAGAWTVNATIKDNNNAYGENSTMTFTYNTLTAMVMAPTSLTWQQVSVSDTNTGSNNDPIIINNTGNAEPLSINVTAFDLKGEVTPTEFIYANNFTVENASQGCSGTAMLNATSRNVTSTVIFRGNNSLSFNNATSGQEETFYCLKGVLPTISAQSYSTAGISAWTIEVIL